jgi:hypothetical protein
MVWILAFSVQDQVEKYGAYVGIASFLGLALLSILYFAQAREVRRLRDWAGRAPERDAELEARVTSQADARRAQPVRPPAEPVRRPAVATLSQETQVTPPPTPAPATPAAVPATNGHGIALPLTVPMGPRPATAAAAIAAATAAATAPAETDGDGEAAEQREGEQAPAPVAQTGVAEPAAPDAGAPGDDDTGETDAGGNGNGTGDIAAIPRATPRPAPAAAPRRAAQPVRASERSATMPPRRTPPARPVRPAPAKPAADRGHGRGILVGVVAGVVVLGLAVLAVTQLGGNDKPATVPPNTTEQPTASDDTSSGSPTTSSGPARADTEVVILNGTTTDGLAAKAKTSLTTGGYTADKIPTDTGPNQATQQSTVYYAPNRRRQALAVGRVLKIDRIAAVDSATQALADNSSDPPVKTDVVVVLGADQTP